MSAAGIKPYKHAALAYQSGCQQITPPDWHTSAHAHKVWEREREARVQGSEGSRNKRRETRDEETSGREETNVWQDREITPI